MVTSNFGDEKLTLINFFVSTAIITVKKNKQLQNEKELKQLSSACLLLFQQ